MRTKTILPALAALLLLAPPVLPEVLNIVLPETEIRDVFEAQDFVGPQFTETNTKIEVTQKTIGTMGPQAAMSPHKAVRLMPSVNQQSVDPAGLSDISNFHESFRFRGVEPTAGGNPGTPVNVENVPITGRPGGGIAVYDMENIDTVAIHKGGVAANQAFGLTNIGGKIDLRISPPDNKFGATVKHSLGSAAFNRTFLRLDTGTGPLGTGAFFSFSSTDADKWKGFGDAERTNLMAGLTQQIGKRLKLSAYALYNDAEVATYRPLSHLQTASLDRYYKYDYTDDKARYDYWGYNKSDFEDYSLLADITYALSDTSTICLKPYYWSDVGNYWESITTKTGAERVRNWEIDHDMAGVLAQYKLRCANAALDIGYFHLRQERPGPPTAWKLYRATASGLRFEKWQLLSNTSNHVQHLPFVAGEYSLGTVTIAGGVKYLNYTMPDIVTYDTAGIGDVPYQTAVHLAGGIDDAACAEEKNFTALLPNLGASCVLNDRLSAYFSYGRNYGLSVKLYPYFISQKAAFREAGITLQDLWDKQTLETADNFDLGLRYISEALYVVPTVYYARHRNKPALYYDDQLGISFPTARMDAEAYGFEMEAGLMPTESLSLYASFSYNRFHFTQDINAASGSKIHVDGQQVPDAPELMFKTIVSYTVGDFTFSPAMTYTGNRYGDILHQEKVGDAALFDIDISYEKTFSHPAIRAVKISLAINNIFNKEYVSIINSSDYATLGATYQTGAPMTVFASASISM